MFACRYCSQECKEPVPPGVCRQCGALESYERQAVFTPAEQASLIEYVEVPRISTGETCIDRLSGGGFPEHGRVIMWGTGGTGKSRLAMRWSTQHIKCLYISLEMLTPIALATAKGCGAILENLYIVEKTDFFERAARDVRASAVVLDSISEVPISERKELLYDLKRWCNRGHRYVILICHQNKKGQHAGSHILQHWPDFELKLSRKKNAELVTVTVQKSRVCPTGFSRTKLGSEFKESSADDDSESDE